MEHSSNYISAQNFNRIFSGSEFNVYCDESCHLEHSSSNAMALGAIWCPKQKTPRNGAFPSSRRYQRQVRTQTARKKDGQQNFQRVAG